MRSSLLFAMALGLAVGTVAHAQDSSSEVQALAQKSLAVTQGTLKVKGLQEPVKVMRDRWGVAHIYAKNQHDLFFAQGYVVSQDRLFQMELWKRSGQGRLAEILGETALARDVNARRLLYAGNMDAEYSSYSPDTKSILEAFTQGINAYIDSIEKAGGPGLPAEFKIARFKPEMWQPQDCLNRMAAFSMMGNVSQELRHAELLTALGPVKATELLDLSPAVNLDPAPNVDFSGLSPQLLKGLVGSDNRIEFPSNALESNNWTVSGKLTESGMPILANDPHRVMAEPSLRYMVHLVAPGWDVIGAGEPALPGVATGHNQQIAWGFTIFGLDQMDLYVEELNPSNPMQYKSGGAWKDMEVKTETFTVRGHAPVSEKLMYTQHGPVLWQNGKRALALRWVGNEPGTAGYLGSLALDRAKNWAEFEDAMKRWKVPSENIVYADKRGNIGEHSIGLSPIRSWTGLLPVPGDGNYEWKGFIPASELPHTFNPAAGYVATANNKMIPDNFPYKVGYQWYSFYRVERIKEVLEEAKTNKQKITVDKMEKLQGDILTIPGRQLVGLLRQAAGSSPSPMTQMLLNWDYRLTTDSAAASLYEIWAKEVASRVEKQVIGDKLKQELTVHQVLTFLSHPTKESFGDNPERERDQILLASVESAATRLSKLEGADVDKWSWGRLHVIRFRHPLDEIEGVKSVMDPSPVARPGDGDTVNATSYHGSFEQTSGASYREILDLNNWDNSVAINVPGQSGQPASPHYSDLLPLWSNGQYFPLSYSTKAIQQVTTDTLTLEP